MVEITVHEAIKALMNIYPGLYADLVADLHKDYASLISQAYLCHRAVIMKTIWYSNIMVWYICDIGNSDMDSARRELSEINNDKLGIIMIHARSLEGNHCLVFSNIGKPYDDKDIRPIHENDREQFYYLTTVPDYDHDFARSIANNLKRNFSDMAGDSSIRIFGIFKEKTLAGVISIKNKNNKEVIVVSNILISHNYRGRGFSTRLIRSAMALYPGIRFIYSCGTDNHPSICAAKSAGFHFEGTYDFS